MKHIFTESLFNKHQVLNGSTPWEKMVRNSALYQNLHSLPRGRRDFAVLRFLAAATTPKDPTLYGAFTDSQTIPLWSLPV